MSSPKLPSPSTPPAPGTAYHHLSYNECSNDLNADTFGFSREKYTLERDVKSRVSDAQREMLCYED
eukprot:1368558-Amorphochlora_amoeboformis.AAC.1